MREDYISQIIEYFKELKELWNNEYKKEIDDKKHNDSKNFSTFSIILTFLLLALTFTNILFVSFSYSSQQISNVNNLINNPQMNNSQDIINNITSSSLNFSATSVETILSIISIVSYLFFGTLLVFLVLIIINIIITSKQYKRIDKFGSEIFDFENIITSLYVIKIKFNNKLNKKEIKKKLLLFDKIKSIHYYHKLKEIVDQLENEKS